jgi:hypothetical protein
MRRMAGIRGTHIYDGGQTSMLAQGRLQNYGTLHNTCMMIRGNIQVPTMCSAATGNLNHRASQFVLSDDATKNVWTEIYLDNLDQ